MTALLTLQTMTVGVFSLLAILSLVAGQTTTTTTVAVSNSTTVAATTTTSSPLPPGKCTPVQNDAILNATSALMSCLRALPGGAPASQACPCHNTLIAGFNAAGCVPSSSSYLLTASKTHCLQSCDASACPANAVQLVPTTTSPGGSSSGDASTASTASGSGASATTAGSDSTSENDATTLVVSIFTVVASVLFHF